MLFRGGISFVAALLAMGALGAPASADHHLVKIAEVFPGTTAAPNTEYVELEMASSGQNVFGGTNATVTLFDADGGAPTHTEGLNATLTNGQSGRRVLVSVNDIETAFPGSGTDFLFNPGNFLTGAGGAACFKPDDSFGASFIDCVSWGNFTGVGLPSTTGGNISPGGITNGQAVHRARQLCDVDLIDTNSPADWSEAAPGPQSNDSPAATSGCPQTEITKAPRKRGTDRTPKVKFVADPPEDATFECRIDNGAFEACDSPHTTKRLSFGKHTFRVAATAPGGTDPTPAKAGFKIVRP